MERRAADRSAKVDSSAAFPVKSYYSFLNVVKVCDGVLSGLKEEDVNRLFRAA